MASAGANLRQIAKASRSFPRRFVDESTRRISQDVMKGLNIDSGGDRILSGTNRRGEASRLRAVVKISGDAVVEGSVKAGPGGRPVAVWHWLEYGTGAPGPTPAKRTWSRSARPMMDAVQDEARRRLSSLVS
jgi:hypothetical protein